MPAWGQPRIPSGGNMDVMWGVVKAFCKQKVRQVWVHPCMVEPQRRDQMKSSLINQDCANGIWILKVNKCQVVPREVFKNSRCCWAISIACVGFRWQAYRMNKMTEWSRECCLERMKETQCSSLSPKAQKPCLPYMRTKQTTLEMKSCKVGKLSLIPDPP